MFSRRWTVLESLETMTTLRNLLAGQICYNFLQGRFRGLYSMTSLMNYMDEFISYSFQYFDKKCVTIKLLFSNITAGCSTTEWLWKRHKRENSERHGTETRNRLWHSSMTIRRFPPPYLIAAQPNPIWAKPNDFHEIVSGLSEHVTQSCNFFVRWRSLRFLTLSVSFPRVPSAAICVVHQVLPQTCFSYCAEQ